MTCILARKKQVGFEVSLLYKNYVFLVFHLLINKLSCNYFDNYLCIGFDLEKVDLLGKPIV